MHHPALPLRSVSIHRSTVPSILVLPLCQPLLVVYASFSTLYSVTSSNCCNRRVVSLLSSCAAVAGIPPRRIAVYERSTRSSSLCITVLFFVSHILSSGIFVVIIFFAVFLVILLFPLRASFKTRLLHTGSRGFPAGCCCYAHALIRHS